MAREHLQFHLALPVPVLIDRSSWELFNADPEMHESVYVATGIAAPQLTHWTNDCALGKGPLNSHYPKRC